MAKETDSCDETFEGKGEAAEEEETKNVEPKREEEEEDEGEEEKPIADVKHKVKTKDVKKGSKRVKTETEKTDVKTGDVKKEEKQALGEALMAEIGDEFGSSLRVPGHKWSSSVPDVCLTEECILGIIPFPHYSVCLFNSTTY